MFANAVYFPSYHIYRGDTPGQMNYNCISHVFYAHAQISTDGSVLLGDEWADARAPCDGVNGGLGSLMHIKQNYPHLQVILSVGGGSSSEIFPLVASNAALRDNFARSALGLVEASGLDGIDGATFPPGPNQTETRRTPAFPVTKASGNTKEKETPRRHMSPERSRVANIPR